MIAVSGCPRSGTSLMMDCLRIGLGEDRILGNKFPQENRMKSFKEKQPGESEKYHQAKLYMLGKNKLNDDIKDLNPNGFWECMYTIQGVRWHLGINCSKDSICKIVSQGLYHSDPKYIDKIIYMIRHPREVAKSQERLNRGPFPSEFHKEEYKVHSPEMYINVTAQASIWLDKHMDIPIHYVYFNELICGPDKVLSGVKEFLGEGDFSNHPIEPKLYRSKSEGVCSHLWEEAEYVYAAFEKRDFKDVYTYVSNAIRKVHRENMNFHCARLGNTVAYNQCLICREDKTTRDNFKKTAESNDIKWKNEPCLFECGFGFDVDHISIQESIENNFWR